MLSLARRQGNAAARAGLWMRAFVAMRPVEMHVGWRIPETRRPLDVAGDARACAWAESASRRLPSPLGLLLGASGRSHSRAWIVGLTTTAVLLPVRA
jgi:hypothetical protein